MQNNRLCRRLIYRLGRCRARTIVGQIERYLTRRDRILDVGSGSGNVCELLRERGYSPTPLDIQDLSFAPDTRPVLFDGVRIPFDDRRFDASLILTVLHHTPDPLCTLREAMRVSRRLIIIEDVYESRPHELLTKWVDSLLSLQFSGHPHNNKTDRQWRQTFDELGLALIDTRQTRAFGIFRLATYHLDVMERDAWRAYC